MAHLQEVLALESLCIEYLKGEPVLTEHDPDGAPRLQRVELKVAITMSSPTPTSPAPCSYDSTKPTSARSTAPTPRPPSCSAASLKGFSSTPRKSALRPPRCPDRCATPASRTSSATPMPTTGSIRTRNSPPTWSHRPQPRSSPRGETGEAQRRLRYSRLVLVHRQRRPERPRRRQEAVTRHDVLLGRRPVCGAWPVARWLTALQRCPPG